MRIESLDADFFSFNYLNDFLPIEFSLYFSDKAKENFFCIILFYFAPLYVLLNYLKLISSCIFSLLISLLTPNIDKEHGEIFLEDSFYNEPL